MLPYPSTWTAPKFQLGMTVLAENRPCQVVGLEYQTEATRPTGSDMDLGWWVLYSYERWVNGKRIVDVQGSHESVIQPMSDTVQTAYNVPSFVSR